MKKSRFGTWKTFTLGPTQERKPARPLCCQTDRVKAVDIIITTCNININVIATVRSAELKYRHAAWCQMFFTDVI